MTFLGKMFPIKKAFVFTLLSLFFLGCSKLDEFTQFSITYDSEVTIPAATPVDLPFNLITPPISTESGSAFSSNNTNKDLIETIFLTDFTLSLKTPEAGNFNFLETIEIYIEADNLPEIKLAWLDDIPNDGSRILELETTAQDLKSYIKKDEYSLRFATTTDEVLTQDHVIDVESIFFVDAKILGI
ncbi:MAG: hypothetical protein SchgKO_15420 [Schleiferiaceae bacterium]